MSHFPKTAGAAGVSLILAIWGAALRAGGYGFHVGSTPPAVYAAQLEEAGLGGEHGGWVRMRELPDPAVSGVEERVNAAREGLLALRGRGVRTAVRLFGVPRTSKRMGRGVRVPIDLREAHAYGLRLGLRYGDLVDAWEIHNEPDIGFLAENPETYAAYVKAMYLGLHAGIAGADAGATPKRTSNVPANPPTWRSRKRGLTQLDLRRSAATGERRAPLVIMAPLALPPGPYLERLWDNGIASYTDGFDFHYYGYAEDFTGVYRQFEDAVKKLGAGDRAGAVRGAKKELPVFITEYGYGLLSGAARDTVEGRVRQWRWFADVSQQVRALRPEGPMAFLWTPHYEADLNEFGLMMETGPVQTREGEAEAGRSGAPQASRRVQDGFGPGDFGQSRIEPWMRRIGQRVGDWYASPALAYLWDYAEKNPYRPRHWSVRALPASPVVIDLIAGRDMRQVKSSGGYVLDGSPARSGTDEMRTGQARLVIYNFSGREVAGRVKIEAPSPVATSMDAGMYTLGPGERQELPVELEVSGKRWTVQRLRVRFLPKEKGVAPAIFSTRLYPDLVGMAARQVGSFDHAAEESRHERLAARGVATGEPRLVREGRWWVTEGVRVEEAPGGVWRFHVDHLPVEPLRPAAAELPLPDGFSFPRGAFISLERRRVDVRSVNSGDGEPTPIGRGVKPLPELLPHQRSPRGGKAPETMGVYFRTENGNLFQTWPRLRVTTEWLRYFENADNFTMAFFGRAKLPWRFAENQPVSLVFFLRPSTLPAVIEVRGAEIVRFGMEPEGESAAR